MIRPRSALALIVLPLSAAVTLSDWQYRKAIQVTPGPALAVVKLYRDVYAHARPDLADLRVLRDTDEVPYVLEVLGASSEQRERAAEILDQSVSPDSGLQFTLKLSGHARHNHVRLQTSEQNFRQAVRIETSEDGKRWSVARADGAIFDFSQGDRQISALGISYPVSTRPFLRVTVRGWTKVNAVSGAYVDLSEARSASRETVATLSPQIAEESKTKSTLLTLDSGVEGLPVDLIQIETPSPSFQRAVAVESSRNGKDWTYLTQGVIARLPGEETLAVPIAETHDRYLRLRIYNQDDQPLMFGKVQLRAIIRHVKFIASTAGKYWLYFGNKNAAAPVYDLPALLSHRENLDQISWTTGPEETNAAYRPPPEPVKPWSEQHPGILYTVLGLAVAGLGFATLRFALGMRRPN